MLAVDVNLVGGNFSQIPPKEGGDIQRDNHTIEEVYAMYMYVVAMIP